MVHLERSVATLRIMGDELVPEEISRLLLQCRRQLM